MNGFFARSLEALVKALPVALVRLLLLAVLVGAATLHYLATTRIEVLERTQDALQIQNGHVVRAVSDLTNEVRGYREDIRAENKALKAKGYAKE